MDIFTELYILYGAFLIKLLFYGLIFQTLGFFWFVWVFIRFGLLRREKPVETIGGNIVSLEEARRALDVRGDA